MIPIKIEWMKDGIDGLFCEIRETTKKATTRESEECVFVGLGVIYDRMRLKYPQGRRILQRQSIVQTAQKINEDKEDFVAECAPAIGLGSDVVEDPSMELPNITKESTMYSPNPHSPCPKNDIGWSLQSFLFAVRYS